MNVIEVKNLEDNNLAVYTKLTEAQLKNKLDPQKGLFIAESPKVINTALDNGYEVVSFLMERKHIEGQAKGIIEKAIGNQKDENIPIYTGDRGTLASLTGYELTRGILAAMRRKLPKDPVDIIKDAKRVCLLEGIVDSTNIGAIFRSAAALNMDAVLLSPSCSDPYNRRAVRVSMGTVFQVPWAFIENDNALWPECGMKKLHSLGFKTAAMALEDNSVSIDNENLKSEEKLCVIMGTEGEGLSKKTIELSDYVVKIPMAHGVDSLNVAAASSVAFWELRKR